MHSKSAAIALKVLDIPLPNALVAQTYGSGAPEMELFKGTPCDSETGPPL
jgi:hypothetical protein